MRPSHSFLWFSVVRRDWFCLFPIHYDSRKRRCLVETIGTMPNHLFLMANETVSFLTKLKHISAWARFEIQKIRMAWARRQDSDLWLKLRNYKLKWFNLFISILIWSKFVCVLDSFGEVRIFIDYVSGTFSTRFHRLNCSDSDSSIRTRLLY